MEDRYLVIYDRRMYLLVRFPDIQEYNSKFVLSLIITLKILLSSRWYYEVISRSHQMNSACTDVA